MTKHATNVIQLADDPADIKNSGRLKLFGSSKEQIPALTYLIAETGHGRYFSQIATTKVDLNLSSRDEFAPASLTGAMKVLDGSYARDTVWNTGHYYQSEMLAHEHEGKISAPMTRPGAGTVHAKAAAAEICLFTGLPESGWDIGRLSHVTDDAGRPVSIRITEHILRHHILSAGTTGHGKTTTNANIVFASREAGFATLIYDQKPDYIEIDKPNPNHPDPLVAAGIADAKFWTLGPMERRDAILITVEASELHPEMLANTICWKGNEEIMAEVLGIILTGYAMEKKEKKRAWSWDEFMEWFGDCKDHTAMSAKLPFPVKLNERTFGGIQWRLRAGNRIPRWIRRSDKADEFGPKRTTASKTASDFFKSITAGSVHVVRGSGDDEDARSYGLFLDYAMRKVRNRRKAGGPKVVHMIDECSDIFCSGNKTMRDLVVGSLNDQTRKGRSLKIGVVLSAQSAGDVPPEIRQNLNSVIVFKHKNPSILREVLPEQANDVFGVVNNLQRGEALVHLFGVRGLIHANMNLAPCKLYEPGEDTE